MAIYDIEGQEALNAYQYDGSSSESAFDIDGEMIFPEGDKFINVMTFNVGSFYSEWHPAPASAGDAFYERHQNIFSKYSIDFGAFSEWYNKIGNHNSGTLMREYFRDYRPDYTPYPTDGFALTSAYSVSPKNVTLHAYQTQGSQTRYYQKSYVSFYGRKICCILTHLDLDAAVREAQFLEVLGAVADEDYFIICGDFNFEITAVGDSEYNKSIKIALDRGYNSAQNSSNLMFTWYSGETTGSSETSWALDNIITSPTLPITNVVRDETKLTDGLCSEYGIIIDHLPVVAIIKIS